MFLYLLAIHLKYVINSLHNFEEDVLFIYILCKLQLYNNHK